MLRLRRPPPGFRGQGFYGVMMMFHDSAYRSDNPCDVPGSSGPTATVQADPAEVASVRTSYAPDRDGDPDPGEIVWTWVPFEEVGGSHTVSAGRSVLSPRIPAGSGPNP